MEVLTQALLLALLLFLARTRLFFVNIFFREPLLTVPLTTLTTVWRFDVAVMRWSRSTQLLYIEPG